MLRDLAESMTGPTISWASGLAERLRIHLLAGSFPERPSPGSDRDGGLFNTSCLIGPTGSVEAVYRKIHLFDVTLEGAAFRESATVIPGDQLCVSILGPAPDGVQEQTPVLGLSLCYDLRFPEMYRIMALRGATVMAVPAAFTAATGPSTGSCCCGPEPWRTRCSSSVLARSENSHRGCRRATVTR